MNSGALRVDLTADGVAFWIHVTPRARRARVGGLHADALRVAVNAPPVEGRANAACADAMAEALGVRRASVVIDPGSRGRRKRVSVSGESMSLRERLLELASDPSLG